VTSLSESSQGEVEDNREKWGDFWEKVKFAMYQEQMVYRVITYNVNENM
jgi:hypothetical protein